MENIKLSFIKIFFSVLLVVVYIVGFVYDSVFLEDFGFEYYQLIGSPLDYLSVGGLFFFSIFVKNLLAVFFLILVSCIGFLFGGRVLDKIVDKCAGSVFIIGLRAFGVRMVIAIAVIASPILCMIFFNFVVGEAQEYAGKVKKEKVDELCLGKRELDEGSVEMCMKGIILRYRDSKVMFWNLEERRLELYLEKYILKAIHGVTLESKEC